MNLESGRTGLQLFVLLLRNSLNGEKRAEKEVQYTCNIMTCCVLLLTVAMERKMHSIYISIT